MFRRKKNKKGSKVTSTATKEDKYATSDAKQEQMQSGGISSPSDENQNNNPTASSSSSKESSLSAGAAATMGNKLDNPASSDESTSNNSNSNSLSSMLHSDSGEGSKSNGSSASVGADGQSPSATASASTSSSLSSANGSGNTNSDPNASMKKTRSTPMTKSSSSSVKAAKGYKPVGSMNISSNTDGKGSGGGSTVQPSASSTTAGSNGNTMASAATEETPLRDNSSKSKDEANKLKTSATDTTAAVTNSSTNNKKTNFGKLVQVNYDVSPTLLYKFIEYKDWPETLARIKDAPEEARVWVYRVEDYNPENDDDGQTITTFTGTGYIIRWRMLPIHVAVIFNAPIKVIMALYKAYPEGLMEGDDRKMLPIHLACRVVSNVNVAQFLIYKSEESLKWKDYKGRTALDILKEYRQQKNNGKNGDDGVNHKREIKNREALIKLCNQKLEKVNSKDVHVSDDDDDQSDAEEDFGEVSADNKDNANTRNDKEEEEVPVKVEKKKNSFGQKIAKSMRIQRTEPKLAEPSKEVDYDSYPTVLIKLIERKMWEQAITRCVEVPQEASTWMCRLQEVKGKKEEKDEVRWKILPIHSAIVLHAPVEVIEALVDAYPQGLQKGDDRQMLPLHMAFRLGSSPETAAVLVDAYPEALKKKDSRGHTPLHILKAYRRKYIKDRDDGKSSSEMDINRKKLIKFYLGGRRYGQSTSEDRLRKYESDSESDYESSDEESYYDSDDDKLFYKDMFHDFAKLTSEGITSFPYIVRDTLACRGGSYDLGA